MRSFIAGLIVALMVSIGSPAISMADTIITEPIEVVGFGATKDKARDEARELRDTAISDVEAGLPAGDEVVGVISTFEWDGIAYEITFEIVIETGS